jgi:hypothetical protein
MLAGGNAFLTDIILFSWNISLIGLVTVLLVAVRPFRATYKNVGMVAVLGTAAVSAVSNLLATEIVGATAVAVVLSYAVVAACLAFMAVTVIGFSVYWIRRKCWYVSIRFL